MTISGPAARKLTRALTRPLTQGQGGGYEAEALALFARFTAPPVAERKGLINTLIKSLKAAGVWTKLDALYLFAAADAQAARQNWIQDLYNATAVSSPTFTADRGYAGDGASAYVNSNFNATTASSPKFVQDSAHVSGWNLTSRAANNTSLLGARESTTKYIDIVPRAIGDLYIGRLNGNGTAVSTANSNSTGLFTINRSASNALQGYRNGASLGTSANVSAGSPNAQLIMLARSLTGAGPDSWTTDQIAAVCFGSSLTSVEEAAKYAAILTYLQAVGAA